MNISAPPAEDNPPLPEFPSGGSGPDPLFAHQWGMQQMGVVQAWERGQGRSEVIVAAIDEHGHLGAFSNWGAHSVHIAAPGVRVFSTVVQSERYTDTTFSIFGLMKTIWDGTSMATPHVARAAALYLSQHPEKSWRDAKNAILQSAKKIRN